MKYKAFLVLFIVTINLSCKNKNKTKQEWVNPVQDTTKLYQKITVQQKLDDYSSNEIEFYVSKKNDTFWNQHKYYYCGVLDRTKSKFFNIDMRRNTIDSVIRGKIDFYSPLDTIPQSKIVSRSVVLSYLEKEKDSVHIKEIETEKNIIEFKWKNTGGFGFVGIITDYLTVQNDRLSDEVLIYINHYAIDSEISTNSPFIESLHKKPNSH